MAKMTIYVPDALKARMDEAEGVNWSPLACQAFEAKLAEIITNQRVIHPSSWTHTFDCNASEFIQEVWSIVPVNPKETT